MDNNFVNLKPGERIDDLQRNGYKIIQNPEKFCFGIDAVLLSHFVAFNIKKNSRILDMGTGTCILPILIAALKSDTTFEALEIQEESADMAARSVELNNLSDKIHINIGNIKDSSNIFGKQIFDAVVTNPPYMKGKHGLQNPDLPKAIARHEIHCSLEDVIRESSLVLKPKRSLYMVHRPQRLPEIFSQMQKYHLEPKRMCLVYPYIDKEPNMVLIEAVKDGNPQLTIEKPIIVYSEKNIYTQQILDIYGYS